MSMSRDRYCGNCGNPRLPDDRSCRHCGASFSVFGFDTSAINSQTPTQLSSSTTQPIWQPSSPAYSTGTPDPLPASHSRWTTRLLIGQGVLVLVLLSIILVLIVRPFAGSNPPPTQSIVPTPTATRSPTIQPTPPYASNLSSTNPNLFVNAFADALQEQDVASIEPHTDTLNFEVVCDQRGGLPGTCDTSWYELKGQLASGTVILDLPQDATLNQSPPLASLCPDEPDPSGFLDFIVVGTFDQVTDNLPLSHLGTAVLGFECVTCGSRSTWAWRAVFLC